MTFKGLVDLSCEAVGKYAHLYQTSDLTGLPINLIQDLLIHIGPLTLLLLELDVNHRSADLQTRHIWREFLRLRWPYKYQRTPDLFQCELKKDRCPRKAYLELHFKHILRKLYSEGEGDDPMSQRFPWIHLTPLTALRKTSYNVNFQTNAFTPPNPAPDFGVEFYASHISTLVISVRQLPCMVRDASLMRKLVNHVRELHVHGAVGRRHYVLLRHLLVTLQYRGALETVVLFNQRLPEESFSELLSIMSGCVAGARVEEFLRERQGWQMAEDCIGETSQSQNQSQNQSTNQSHCQGQNLILCQDQTEKQSQNLDQSPVAVLNVDQSDTSVEQNKTADDTQICANGDSDETSMLRVPKCSADTGPTAALSEPHQHKRHKADSIENNFPSLENKVYCLSEEDMLYDSIYNSHASDGDSRSDAEGDESFNIYTELLDESTQPKFSHKGLKGFGLVSDRSNCDFVEDVLERYLQNWPSLQKLALSNTNLRRGVPLLVGVVASNALHSLVVQNLHDDSTHVDAHGLFRGVLNSRQRRKPLQLLNLSELKFPARHAADIFATIVEDPTRMILPIFTGIVELDLSFTEFYVHENVLCLAHYLKQDADLRVLRLDGSSGYRIQTLMDAFKECTGLRVLTLSRSSGVTMEHVDDLLQAIPTLTKLDVSECGIEGSTLHLDNTDPGEAEKQRSCAQHLLSTILTHPHLTDLNLSDNHLAEFGHTLLQQLMSSPRKLQKIALRNTSLVDATVTQLGRRMLEQTPRRGRHLLQTLELSWDATPELFAAFYDVVKEFILVSSEKRTASTADYVAMM